MVFDAESIGHHAVIEVDHVVVAVMREFGAQPVGRLARPAAADGVGHDDQILRRVERLARREQFVGEARPQPVGPGAGITLQQQHGVDDITGGVALRRAERAIMHLQLGQALAAVEAVVFDDEVGLLIVGPFHPLAKGGGSGDGQRDGTKEAGEHWAALRVILPPS